MAVVSSLGATVNTTTGSKTVTATPALLDLIVVVTCVTGQATTVGLTDNNTGGHGTYIQITSALKNTSADFLQIWVRADRVTSATSTIWTMTTGGADTGGGLEVFKITGMSISGPAAVRHNGAQANQALGGTPAPALGAAALTGNCLISAVFNASNPAGVTVPTSWTAGTGGSYNVPGTGLGTAFINSGFTGSTVTWGSTSASAFSDVAIELDTSVPLVYPPSNADKDEFPYILQAVNKSSLW